METKQDAIIQFVYKYKNQIYFQECCLGKFYLLSEKDNGSFKDLDTLTFEITDLYALANNLKKESDNRFSWTEGNDDDIKFFMMEMFGNKDTVNLDENNTGEVIYSRICRG
jgi:hypothetical protein